MLIRGSPSVRSPSFASFVTFAASAEDKAAQGMQPCNSSGVYQLALGLTDLDFEAEGCTLSVVMASVRQNAEGPRDARQGGPTL